MLSWWASGALSRGWRASVSYHRLSLHIVTDSSTAQVGVKGAEQRLAGTPMIDDYIKTPEQVLP